MAIYLLDTPVIINVLNQKRGRWQLLASFVDAGDKLACSVVTVTEILRRHSAQLALGPLCRPAKE
jgi:predicted nucleic acid-binding protein